MKQNLGLKSGYTALLNMVFQYVFLMILGFLIALFTLLIF